MATNLLPIHVTGIRTSTFSGHRSSDNHRRKSSIAASAGNTNWWSPLFGWSTDADYIDSTTTKKEDPIIKSEKDPDQDSDPKQARSSSKFAPGCFTAEKAKQLRMMTKETASFHDVMYHSAIASRLASDFSGRSGQ